MSYEDWKETEENSKLPKPSVVNKLSGIVNLDSVNYSIFVRYFFAILFTTVLGVYCLVTPTLMAGYARTHPDISMFGWFFMWIGIIILTFPLLCVVSNAWDFAINRKKFKKLRDLL